MKGYTNDLEKHTTRKRCYRPTYSGTTDPNHLRIIYEAIRHGNKATKPTIHIKALKTNPSHKEHVHYFEVCEEKGENGLSKDKGPCQTNA